MENQFKEVAESLLGQALKESDGLELAEIEQAERDLGQNLPKSLKQFWRLVGRLQMFMSSFEVFLKPAAVFFCGDYCVFQEENQGVCHWGIKVAEINNPDATVYQCTDINAERPEWHSEEISLPCFLIMLMYYQCAQGGYEYGAAVYESEFDDKDEYQQFLTQVTAGWPKVVEHHIECNGLAIYAQDTSLIWHFTDKNGEIADIIFASSLMQDRMAVLEEEYGFYEL